MPGYPTGDHHRFGGAADADEYADDDADTYPDSDAYADAHPHTHPNPYSDTDEYIHSHEYLYSHEYVDQYTNAHIDEYEHGPGVADLDVDIDRHDGPIGDANSHINANCYQHSDSDDQPDGHSDTNDSVIHADCYAGRGRAVPRDRNADIHIECDADSNGDRDIHVDADPCANGDEPGGACNRDRHVLRADSDFDAPTGCGASRVDAGASGRRASRGSSVLDGDLTGGRDAASNDRTSRIDVDNGSDAVGDGRAPHGNRDRPGRLGAGSGRNAFGGAATPGGN